MVQCRPLLSKLNSVMHSSYKVFHTIIPQSKQTPRRLPIIGHLHWPLRPRLRPPIGPERLTSSGRGREARCTSTAGDETRKQGVSAGSACVRGQMSEETSDSRCEQKRREREGPNKGGASGLRLSTGSTSSHSLVEWSAERFEII